MSHLAYISLGGNIGNTLEIFQNALLAIEKKLGKIIQKSKIQSKLGLQRGLFYFYTK